jgi:Predicted integral membrane protein
VSQTDLEPEIAHLLLIDIVGYSKLLVNEQIEAVQELNRVVRGTECFRKAEADGKLLRVPTGDGMILLFSNSPEQPIRCALEIAEQLKERPQVQVRMGIHSGPANQVRDVNDQVNVVGAGINIAQRVMDCGDAGHILLSKHIADDLVQYRNWRSHLHDLGEYEVKHGLRLSIFSLYKDNLGNPNLPEKLQRRKRRRQTAAAIVKPVHSRWSIVAKALVFGAIAVALGVSIYFGYDRFKRSRAGAAAPEKSIAVLPFENRSADPENAYFADSIQDEILTRLAKISDLKVISRTSTQYYKSTPQNLREIARQLGVAHIVEGAVQKSGDAVRVNVQLIKAEADTHVWADTFDRKLTDIFSVESEVAKTIAEQLRAKLTGQESQFVDSLPTENPDAYDNYLRGLAYTLKAGNTRANLASAQKYFKEAVRLDPKFALGWAQLSCVDAVGYITLNLQPTAELREEARYAAEIASQLQPSLGEAHYAQGYYSYACLKDYDAAVRHFEEARRLLPNSSRVPEALAYVARRRGEWSQSEAYFKEAERLDPRNVSLLTSHAHSYITLRKFSEATNKFDQVLDITPDDPDILVGKVAIAQALGDLPAAGKLLSAIPVTADAANVLKIKIYQAILEHRPKDVIARIEEGLVKNSYGGDLLFWAGWAQKLSGDENANLTLQRARDQLELALKERPEDFGVMGDLAMINAILGDKPAALSFAERAMNTISIKQDALVGPSCVEIFARVAAQAGQYDRSVSALEKLVARPYAGPFPENVPLTQPLLRLDPMFQPLRGNPRFQKLLGSEAANQSAGR